MHFKLSERLAATGIVGLAALTAAQWLRENIADPEPITAFTLGILPNLTAAFAMPLILASFSDRTSGTAVTLAIRLAYIRVLLFTTSGLCGWELLQTQMQGFVFDVYDLLATGLGSIIAYQTFVWHVRLISRRPLQKDHKY